MILSLLAASLRGTIATWKRNNDVGIGGIAEGGLSVPSPFGHKTAEEQQVGCPKHHDWSEKIEKVPGRSFSLLERTPPQLGYGCFLSLLFAQHMEGGDMIRFLL
jgi:hypothetical protein